LIRQCAPSPLRKPVRWCWIGELGNKTVSC
jgi:hypothetical protein